MMGNGVQDVTLQHLIETTIQVNWTVGDWRNRDRLETGLFQLRLGRFKQGRIQMHNLNALARCRC